MFFYLCKVLFSGFLQFKGNFVDGQNNSKYHDRAPLRANSVSPCRFMLTALPMFLWLFFILTNQIKLTRPGQYYTFDSRSYWFLVVGCYADWFLLHLVLSSQQAMAKRPVSAVGNRRPITEYAKMAAAMGGHMRYKVSTAISETTQRFVLFKVTLRLVV